MPPTLFDTRVCLLVWELPRWPMDFPRDRVFVRMFSALNDATMQNSSGARPPALARRAPRGL
eukprot:3629809-Pyramimonas_sp.AAC.1